ncbi:MAG: capsular polysaccharide synthesis protein [Bacteroidia bacterium]
MGIPKIIWIYWATGFEDAPFIIKRCVASWKQKNPGWEVNLLDNNNLYDFIGPVDMRESVFERLPIQKKANLIRLKLVLERGGVWVDATCYCLKPLESWLFDSAPGGFFMFYKPGRDRIISNWFVAGAKGNYLIKRLYERRCAYWDKNDFNHKSERQRKWVPFLCRVINRNEVLPLIWLTPLFTKILRIYPYLIFHYDFYWLVKVDKQCAKIWAMTRKINAGEAHKIQRLGMVKPLTEEGRKFIDSTATPLFKLSYKIDAAKMNANSVSQYLFDNY